MSLSDKIKTLTGRAVTGKPTPDQAPDRVVPDSTAATAQAAQEEARKGTAAAEPVIGITPEGQTLAGAIVNGEFVEAPEHLHGATAQAGSRDEERVASGEIPGENEAMKNTWWTGKSAQAGSEREQE
jgi:hypothetical protein